MTTQTHPVLGQLALGYCPMIDRKREVVATRLVMADERAGTQTTLSLSEFRRVEFPASVFQADALGR